MNKMEIKNAVIDFTMLGYEGHGILTFTIGLDYGGSGQCFGQNSLDQPIKDEAGKFIRRRGTAYGMEAIARLLSVVGVEKWEALKGKSVRVEAADNRVKRIGHYLKDEWLDMALLAEEFAYEKD